MNSSKRHSKSAVLLFSGGLDSILAYKHLKKMGFEIYPVFFKTSFFSGKRAQEYARKNEIPLEIVDVSEEYLEKVIKNPKYGYGSGMNPCIDCKIFMQMKAIEYARLKGVDFIATGEVVGQRPMSQERKSILLIEREAGTVGRVIRPLTGKHLPPTEAEKMGLYNREELLDITGRGRKRQFQLARDYGVKYYPTPAGGCILTEPVYSKRLKLFLLGLGYRVTTAFTEILSIGRHFYVEKRYYLILPRDEREKELLDQLLPSLEGDYREEMVELLSPSGKAAGVLFLLPGVLPVRSLKELLEERIFEPSPGYLVAPYVSCRNLALKFKEHVIELEVPVGVEKHEVARYFFN